MAKRIGGPRRKTRGMLMKKRGDKGKVSLTRYLQVLNAGDRVVLKAEPAVHRGQYFRRFHGMIGTVKEQKGSCYFVQITDKTKPKTLIVHPVHLKKV